MRKRIVDSDTAAHAAAVEWLPLENIAEVEVSSEDPLHPVEAALLPAPGGGWRASTSGRQSIRLIFSPAQRLCRIRLVFVETAVERTQEYLLRCWSSDGRTVRDIVRQQWTFSPQGSTCETEEHRFEACDVDELQLIVVPDISGGSAVASLAELRVA